MNSYQQIYQTGVSFAQFLQGALGAERDEAMRFAMSVREPGCISVATQQRFAALKGTYHLLIAAESWCPDCRIQLGAFDYLRELQPRLDLAIISKGRAENDLQVDLGLNSILIPVIAILDERFACIGKFVERPTQVAQGRNEEVLARYRQGELLEHALLDLLGILEDHEGSDAH
ncbi:thioredoxin family protein [Pseudomonas alabamensis]|uniref:thioredoxin family protein n=1 Tax=Pseudomonas alabamensis TaxID=3064349 RepID=UPI003F649C23